MTRDHKYVLAKWVRQGARSPNPEIRAAAWKLIDVLVLSGRIDPPDLPNPHSAGPVAGGEGP